MPELPEVETTRRGIEPHIRGKKIVAIQLRIDKLRWALNKEDIQSIIGEEIECVNRRGKYLLIPLKQTNKKILIHLGMSGSLRICTATEPLKKHDHIIIQLSDGEEMRLHDPRRFGHFAVIDDEHTHPLLKHLGVEPLSDHFDVNYLYQSIRGKKTPIKNHIMNQKIVVGVGNIYATEALYLAGIRPDRVAHTLNKSETTKLVKYIKQEFNRGIESGGSTLRDFLKPDGSHGYFQQTLQVYGRSGETCKQCGSCIENKIIGNRASSFCPNCQQ